MFLRAWVAVDLPRLYNPVTNLLGPAPAPPDFPRARKEQEVTLYVFPSSFISRIFRKRILYQFDKNDAFRTAELYMLTCC